MKKALAYGAIIVAFGVIVLATLNIYVVNVSHSYITNSASVPTSTAVIILGARVYADGRLSDVVRDRADTALELYHSGKVRVFLVSGDHGTTQYDEVNTIRKYLEAHGVPDDAIFLDHAGFDTYDSMYRAKAIFGVTSTIIATQNFHLPRAVYIARKLGLVAYGTPADRHYYRSEGYWELREILSRVKAFLDIILHAKPKFLGSSIPITGSPAPSWDQ